MEQNTREVARGYWEEVRRVRQEVLHKIDDIRKGRGGTNFTSQFENVESVMKELRLACMRLIFHDFDYAAGKDVESVLWQAHTHLNGEYRRILSRLGSQAQAVQKRKVDKLYRDFLKTSQSFYRGYIQRLSSLFCIPELRQAAHAMELASADTTGQDVAPPSPLRIAILSACYMTLVRLGDLARYRCQAADKPSKNNFNIALTYYSLANTLDPDDGSSHHQMGVLYQLQQHPLEIIYYFHRSISIAKPYKLGPSNLESGFKRLENPSNTKRGAAKDPSETMTAWFLSLHAHYYLGEPFAAQAELEEEVLHRLDMSVKVEGNGEVLLKMLLINIAAYDIASDKVKANWTLTGSQSCQFMLSFNMRTALILLRLLKSALQENATLTTTHDSGNDSQGNVESTTSFLVPLSKLLPLCRIYIAWIYVCRADFVAYQEYLEPHIRELYRLLGDVLTRLFPYVDLNQRVVESKYLLPEDSEAVGLKILSDRKLPLFLKVEVSPDINPPKRRKSLKPRKEVLGIECKAETETVWRIRDIVCCGIYLAGSGKFPLAMGKDASGVETWRYTEENSNHDYLDEASMTQTFAKLKLGVLKTSLTGEDTPNIALENVNIEATKRGYLVQSAPLHMASVDNGQPMEAAPTEPLLESDLSRDSEMVKMVDNLLDTDDDEVNDHLGRTGVTVSDDMADMIIHHSNQAEANTSYDIDSSTADDIFGRLALSQNGQTAAAADRTGPNSPWDYFYTPRTRRRGTGDNHSGINYDIPRTAEAQLDAAVTPTAQTTFGQRSAFTDGQFTAQTSSRFHTSPLSQERTAHAAQKAFIPSPDIHTSTGSPDYATNQRNTALDNLHSMLTAQYGSGLVANNPRSPGLPLYSSDAMRSAQGHNPGMSGSTFSAGTRESSDISLLGNNRNKAAQRMMDQQANHRRLYGNNQVSGGSIGGSNSAGGFRGPASPTGAAYGHQQAAALLNRFSPSSPGPAPGSFQEQIPSGCSGPSTGSSLVFSHPSSLWGGTPDLPPAPKGFVGCNGNFFNASTAFGRSGEVNNRNDPTHFRNAVKDMFDTDTASSYDKQILEAALAGNGNQPRQK
ncbi:uncharacterized protein BCR38DRAFT_481086 [Pseudomassariella vexata]|uniref:Nonsense-mediated mRNA decay factor n=1 Tax=Pseudomassariella vexata TaxID=1141098 RepID=A0A1Y2EEU2_9PEZI|nr:uncharacterized protein BCR38DRAFT_481086 [Pseudomassariella vexata]ORY69927.1 hypothetical protein BCR38DRAFT_481086 [Pseudomassariella vexata]